METDKKIPDDEIDLRGIWTRITFWLYYPFNLWFNNIKTSLLFGVFAILFAVALKYSITKTYRASFIIRPNDRTEKFHLRIIGDLQLLLKQKDYEGISKALNLSETDTTKLVYLETIHPAIKYTKDSINCTEVFIEATDYTIFFATQNGILNYLENNPYFLKIHELQKKQINLEMKQLDVDLLRLDTLKHLQLANYNRINVSSNTPVLFSDLVNPTTAYTSAIEIMNKKLTLVARQAFLDNFQLVKPCTIIKKSHWPPRILLMCVFLIPLFLFFCFVFLHLKTKRDTKK